MITNEQVKKLSKLAIELQRHRLTDIQKEALKVAIDKAETLSQVIKAMFVAGWAIKNSNNNQRLSM